MSAPKTLTAFEQAIWDSSATQITNLTNNGSRNGWSQSDATGLAINGGTVQNNKLGVRLVNTAEVPTLIVGLTGGPIDISYDGYGSFVDQRTNTLQVLMRGCDFDGGLVPLSGYSVMNTDGFTNSSTTASDTFVRMSYCDFANASDGGLDAHNLTNNYVDHCTFTNFYRVIRCWNGTQIIMANTTIDLGDGAYFFWLYNTLSSVSVYNCTFIDGASTYTSAAAIPSGKLDLANGAVRTQIVDLTEDPFLADQFFVQARAITVGDGALLADDVQALTEVSRPALSDGTAALFGRFASLSTNTAQIVGTHTNAPLLFTLDSLPSEMFDADGTYPAQADGGDVRFFSDSNLATGLPCEIIDWSTDNNPALGSALIWVKVPNVRNAQSDTIYVAWNTGTTDTQPSVSDPLGSEAVWSAYEEVTHDLASVVTGSGKTLTPNGTPVAAVGPFGDTAGALGFGATLGTGATDATLLNLTTALTGKTVQAWTYRNGGGGGDFGRIFDKGGAAYWGHRTGGIVGFIYSWDTTVGRWFGSTMTASAWESRAVYYDGSSTANDPALYDDGAVDTPTENSTPAGSAPTDTAGYMLGNRAAAPGGGAITKVGETTFTAAIGTGTEAKTLPGTLQENDIVFVSVTCDNTMSISTEGLQTSNGYTIIYATTTESAPAYHIGYKVMGATPDTTVTIGQESFAVIAGLIQVWRGQDLTTPMDVTAVGPDTGASGDPTNPAITTVTDGSLVMIFAGVDDDDAVTVTEPSGYSNKVFGNTGLGGASGSTVMVASKIVTTAGLETPGIWAASSDDQWKAVTVALRPASSGATYDRNWDGAIAELRIYDGQLSSSWLETEYNAQTSPATFWTVGSPQSPIPATVTYNLFAGSIESATSTGTVTLVDQPVIGQTHALLANDIESITQVSAVHIPVDVPSARTVPYGVIRESIREESAEAYLIFLTMTHDSLSDAVRVVSNPVDCVLDGFTFTGFRFNITLVSDNEQPPFAQLQIQNVSRLMNEVILNIKTPPKFRVEVIAASEFNLTVDPHTEIATAGRTHLAEELTIGNVDADALSITGRLQTWDYTSEIWPGIMATQDAFPGLFR